MRRQHLVFLATLQLCRARSRSFSIHEDLLAFPQFEVVFSDNFISEKDAHALLDSHDPHPTYSADFSQPTIGDATENHDGTRAGSLSGVPLTYEVINMLPHRYLCSILVIQPPELVNQTANELAKAEEAREQSRAAASGWDLLNELEDTCLYFLSGWWSYSFCNNREIVQFHALPSTPNGQPPRPDPKTTPYVLGRVPAIPASSETQSRSADSDASRVPAELQVKGDQRYLVQRLEGGTVCDLTGRERTIEVQYHCVPGMQGDRIGWIKEVTICAYVMVVNTARLCDDVAFLPPEENKANPITCQLITDDGKPTPPLLDQPKPGSDSTKQAQKQQEDVPLESQGITVGGVVVGGRKVISNADKEGQPPMKLAPPRNYINPPQTPEESLIEVIVQAASKEDGGKIETLSREELEKLDLKPEVVEEMRERMRKLAGDLGWQLEIVEIPGDDARELRGWIHDGADAKNGKGKPKKKGKENSEQQGAADNAGDADKGKGGGQGKEDKGSEEQFFKEEL